MLALQLSHQNLLLEHLVGLVYFILWFQVRREYISQLHITENTEFGNNRIERPKLRGLAHMGLSLLL